VTSFDDGDDLPVPGRLRAIHTPGHTEGHAAFVSGDVLITGDALCTLNRLTGERGPQVLPAAVSSSVDESLASLDKLVDTGAGLLLSGHGDPQREPNGAVADAKRRGPT
jgi:glyoxylase-like metal-dependent hydrolase (beta-lactamase superfamily II)